MALRYSSVLLAGSLMLMACTQAIHQTAQIVVAKPSPSPSVSTGPFSALGGAGLDPSVARFCSQGDITGDQGYARSMARQYRSHITKLIRLQGGGSNSSSGSIYGEDVSPSGAPTVTPSSQPSIAPTAQATATATADISVIEKTTFNGKVFDDGNLPLDGVTVTAKSLNSSVPFEATATTHGGAYAFNNAPAGVSIEITASRAGYTTRRRMEVLLSNKVGDPGANRFDFGNDGANTAFGSPYNSLSDKPEVSNVLPARNASGIDAATPIVLKFSEPMERASVEQNLVINKQQSDGGLLQAYDTSAFDLSWNSDDTEITLTLKSGAQLEAHTTYRVAFRPSAAIKDKSGVSRSADYFKLTPVEPEADSRFSILRFLTAQLTGALPSPTPLPPTTKARDAYYFSYDDSASVAGVELVKQALRTERLPKPEWARTWEFLNYEPFDHIDQQSSNNGLFKVSLGLWKYDSPSNPYLATYEVGAHVTAPFQCKETRQTLNLTVLVDVSASMNEPAAVDLTEGGEIPSKMTLVRAGLKDIFDSLRPGDVVHLVEFSTKPFTQLENFTVGKDNQNTFMSAVDKLTASGGTNLQAGIEAAYRQAQKLFDKSKMNRVLILTDTKPNESGELPIDSNLIKSMAAQNNHAGIYLSALGMGYTHNQALLNQITEAGRGAYYTIQTRADIKEAMHDRFIPLMSVIARNARFKLEFPGWLRHGKTAAEQVSADPAKVQPTNFSANTSQYFWEQFQANKADYKGNETVKLTISYQDPLNGAQRTEVFEKPLAQILGKDLGNIQAAHMVQLTTSLIKRELTGEQAQAELDGLLAEVGK